MAICRGLMLVILIGLYLTEQALGQCGVSCPACERRFRCMTESWGRCCVQFYQPNGKRSAPSGEFHDEIKTDHIPPFLRRYLEQNSRLNGIDKFSGNLLDDLPHLKPEFAPYYEKPATEIMEPLKDSRSIDVIRKPHFLLTKHSTDADGDENEKSIIKGIKLQSAEPHIRPYQDNEMQKKLSEIKSRLMGYLEDRDHNENKRNAAVITEFMPEKPFLKIDKGKSLESENVRISEDYAKLVEKRRIRQQKRNNFRISGIKALYGTQRIRRDIGKRKSSEADQRVLSQNTHRFQQSQHINTGKESKMITHRENNSGIQQHNTHNKY